MYVLTWIDSLYVNNFYHSVCSDVGEAVSDTGAESKVSVWVERGTIEFPPESAEVPVIMVGPGTGCAPFRSFIHDRTSQETPGRSDLYNV